MLLLIFIATMVISLMAMGRVKGAYAHYSQIPASSGITGAEAAAAVMRTGGIDDVEIVATEGTLTDHYDPMARRLVLSEENYYGRSLAAVGVAAHEAGHALQHQQHYFPLQLRMVSVGVTNIANQMVMWLPIVGYFTGMIAGRSMFLLMAIGWGVIMAFNLVTLPVEFDASNRAKRVLGKLGLIAPGPEAEGVKDMLGAAALTYVASFVTSLLYFLYYLLPLLGSGRRDDRS
jgi:Zn-dependent membrane protease YugP